MNVIDKIIKNKLSHHHAVTPDGMWDNILSKLPDEKKNFKHWWLATAMMAIVLSSISTFLYFSGDLKNSDTNINAQLEINGPIATIKPVELNNKLYETKNIANVRNDKKDWQFYDKESQISNNTDRENLTSLAVKKVDMIHTQFDYLAEAGTDPTKIPNRQSNLKPIQTAQTLQGKNNLFKYSLAFKLPSRVKNHSLCPTVQPIKKRKSLDFYISHDYASKTFHLQSDENLPYKNLRKDTEKSLYSYSIGARVGFEIANNWTLQSGLNYSQINERLQYIDPESNQTREITIKDYVYLNGKIVDSIINKQTVVIPGETQVKVNNTYKSFDIPILGKHTFLNNRRMNISAVAGLYLNITSVQKGMIFDRDSKAILDISSHQSNGEAVFKTYLGVTTFGALSIAYHISPSIDLIAEPNVRLQTQSITSDEYPLAQRFNTYGFLTGVRYNF